MGVSSGARSKPGSRSVPKPITAGVVEAVLSSKLDELEPQLTRNGYDWASLAFFSLLKGQRQLSILASAFRFVMDEGIYLRVPNIGIAVKILPS
jgi:hypothetical protein